MKRYLLITLFSVLYSCGVSLFLDPNQLAPGGVTGIAVICNTLLDLGTGTWVFLINIPILCLGLQKFGGRFMISTVYSIAVISVATNLLENAPVLTTDPLAAALAGGALIAVSVGSVIKLNATTGGIDIIVKILRKKYPHLKTGGIYLLMDSAVVALAMLTFGNFESGIYAGITVLTASYLMNLVLYGTDEARMFLIITDASKEVADRLMRELKVGVTFLEGRGAFSSKKKEIILCITRKAQGPKLENVVKVVDREAFLIVTSAGEIYGEGYKSYDEEII